MALLITMSTQLRAASETCGGASVTVPFEDITGNAFFCQIASAYFSGLTNGTSATTYSPTAPVAREQMAAFVSRTLDQSVKRGSKRAALDQWWLAKDEYSVIIRGSGIGGNFNYSKSDGKDIWVAAGSGIVRIDPVTDTQSNYLAQNTISPILIARGYVYAVGQTAQDYVLYQINPRLAPGVPGAVTIVTTNLGSQPRALAFDGKNIWSANQGGSVSLIDPANNFSVTTIPLGIQPTGILFDGNNMWVTDGGNGNLLKMDKFGFVIQTVVLGGDIAFPTFDGTNIWAPDPSAGKVYIVRASNGVLLATRQLNGAHNFLAAAFDGERVAVTDTTGYVHLWRATDFTYLGNVKTGELRTPRGICSDGTRFWVNMGSDSSGYLLGF
jgi:YVTN family beta-propeller protein